MENFLSLWLREGKCKVEGTTPTAVVGHWSTNSMNGLMSFVMLLDFNNQKY